jgi:7-keto-8-aminopelargonate synthetase-like enzyme
MKATKTPGRTIEVNGSEYLYFGGTAYLGLQCSPEFLEIVHHNIARWGAAWGSSRQSNVTLSAYEAAENYLSGLTGAPSVLTVSSGMMAGRLVIEAIRNITDRFYHFPGLHPAIQVAESLPVLSPDGQLHPSLFSDERENITLLTDAVPSFEVQPVDLGFVNQLPKHKKITLIVDESHALGLCGDNGGGITFGSHFPEGIRKIMVASLGKAIGVSGGMIGADEDFLDRVKNLSGFIGAAGMPPAFAQSLFDASVLIQGQQLILKKNLEFLWQHWADLGKTFLFDKKYPLIYPLKPDLYSFLLEKGILITHFYYGENEQQLSRVVISSHHKLADLQILLNNLYDFDSQQ